MYIIGALVASHFSLPDSIDGKHGQPRGSVKRGEKHSSQVIRAHQQYRLAGQSVGRQQSAEISYHSLKERRKLGLKS